MKFNSRGSCQVYVFDKNQVVVYVCKRNFPTTIVLLMQGKWNYFCQFRREIISAKLNTSVIKNTLQTKSRKIKLNWHGWVSHIFSHVSDKSHASYFQLHKNFLIPLILTKLLPYYLNLHVLKFWRQIQSPKNLSRLYFGRKSGSLVWQ